MSDWTPDENAGATPPPEPRQERGWTIINEVRRYGPVVVIGMLWQQHPGPEKGTTWRRHLIRRFARNRPAGQTYFEELIPVHWSGPQHEFCPRCLGQDITYDFESPFVWLFCHACELDYRYVAGN